MDPPKRLSIALGESYILSHKSSSGGGNMKELWPPEEKRVKWANIALTSLTHAQDYFSKGEGLCLIAPPTSVPAKLQSFSLI